MFSPPIAVFRDENACPSSVKFHSTNKKLNGSVVKGSGIKFTPKATKSTANSIRKSDSRY